MRCTNCGKEVPNTVRACGSCGHILKSNSPAAGQSLGTEYVPVHRAASGWIWGIGGAVIGSILIGLIFLASIFLSNEIPVVKYDPSIFTSMAVYTVIPTSTMEPIMTPTPEATQTEQPTISPSPIPLPIVGIYPDPDTVWDNWVNKQMIHSLNDLINENFDFNSGLEAGREFFPYTVNLKQSQSVIWNTGWCAVNEETLRQNISQISYEFYINSQRIPTDGNFAIRWVPNGSHYCHYQYTVLNDWPVGTNIITTVKIFKSGINDGVTASIFPAGKKVIQYTASISP